MRHRNIAHIVDIRNIWAIDPRHQQIASVQIIRDASLIQ